DAFDEPPRQALELPEAQQGGVALDAPFGAAVGHVHEGRLPGHEARQGAHLVEVDLRMITQSAFVGATGVVVLDAIAAEVADAAVIHLDVQLDAQLPLRGDQQSAVRLSKPKQIEGTVYVEVRRLISSMHPDFTSCRGKLHRRSTFRSGGARSRRRPPAP